MSIVDGVTELEGEHSVSLASPELYPQLLWCEAVLVQSIIPRDPVQHLYVSAHQPVTRVQYQPANVNIVTNVARACSML